MYGDRDQRARPARGESLEVRSDRARTSSADIYNLLNSAPILSYNEAFIPGGAWLLPTSVMTARFAKISVQFDF